jgi:hypothetical protein
MCGDFEQQSDRFDRLASDHTVELLGFSDGSLSGDYTNGGCGWLVAIKSPDEAKKLRILAGGGAALLASSTTNIFLNTTRMEALGLAAGMSYTRETGRAALSGMWIIWGL